jgi:cellobiose phosphorylase
MAQTALGNHEQVGELLRMLNPVRRSETQESAQTYRVEPYVLAADIYSCEGASQRGGWTWYTGAAGWMYRAVLEYVLGIRITGDVLRIAPCVPAQWPDFEVRVQLPGVDYVVRMRRGAVAGQQLLFDGAPIAGDVVPLLRDHRPHAVEMILPQA